VRSSFFTLAIEINQTLMYNEVTGFELLFVVRFQNWIKTPAETAVMIDAALSCYLGG